MKLINKRTSDINLKKRIRRKKQPQHYKQHINSQPKLTLKHIHTPITSIQLKYYKLKNERNENESKKKKNDPTDE